MPTDLGERRRFRRYVPAPEQALSRVRLRTGQPLDVLNISAAGILVESATRLLPDAHVDVHVASVHGRVLVRARVLRCAVSRLSAEEVHYRGAMAFEGVLDLAREGDFLPDGSTGGGALSGVAYPSPGVVDPRREGELLG